MRKIDVFANEKFNGNIKDALLYLLNSNGDYRMDDYVDELSRDEANFVYLALRDKAIKHYGGLENYRSELKKQSDLTSLNLTEEEVRTAEVNPYKASLLKSVLKLLIMDGGILLLSMMSPVLGISVSTLGIGASLFSGIYSLTIVENLAKYVKFSKVKKIIDSEQLQNIELNNERGR